MSEYAGGTFERPLTEDERHAESVWAELVAEAFHRAYERLAPSFGYETRRESAVPWQDVPEANRRLMTAVVADLFFPSVISVMRPEQFDGQEGVT